MDFLKILDYNNSMTHLTRRLIFYLLVGTFLALSPALTLYSTGWTFDFERKTFVKTGVFNFKTAPVNANIHINGKLAKRSPDYIKNLKPGDYEVKISKNGYTDWDKTLRINPSAITEAMHIVLLPLEPEKKIFLDALPPGFSLDNYFSKEQDFEYKINPSSRILYQTNKITEQQSQISIDPLPPEHKYQIISSPHGQIAALSEADELYLFNAVKKSFDLIKSGVKKAVFSPDEKKIAYMTDMEIWVMWLTGTLNQPRINLGEKELITRISRGLTEIVWHNKSENIFFIVDNKIKMAELDGRNNRNIIDFINVEEGKIHIQNRRVYFIEENALKYVNLPNDYQILFLR